MQINSVISSKIIPTNQNFKGNSVSSNPAPNTQVCQSVPLEVSRAYASPQITQGYKEIEIFDVPYVGKGKMYELANGHKIILVPKLGQTLIHTYVGVGMVNEPASLKESSHLLEHLLDNTLFKPNDKNTEDILSRTGAETNAHTNNSYTGYHIKAPITKPEDFEDLIKLQAQALTNTNFTDKDVEDEKNIIIQELNSTGKYTDDYLLAERLATQNLFSLKDSDDAILPRSIASIKNIKKEDLINFYNTFYNPKNMVTTIIGTVDDETIKTVAKHLGKIQAPQTPITKIDYPKIQANNLIQKTIRKDIQSLDKNADKAYVDLAFIGPKPDNLEDNIAVFTLRWIINEQIKKINKNEKRDIGIKSTSDNISSDKTLPSILRLNGTSYNDDVEEDLKSVYSVLYDLTQHPISQEELNTVKDKIKFDVASFNENSFFLSVELSEAGMLSQNLDVSKELEIINSLTPQDIQNAAKKYLDFNKASLVVVHPQEKTKVSPFDKVESAKRLSFTGNAEELQMKDVHEYVLPNNLRVVIDSRPGIATSTIKFDLHSKKTLTPDNEAVYALVKLMASEDTQKKLEKEGIKYTLNGNSQELFTNFNGDADKTLDMLGYAAGILLNPQFSSERFDKIKDLLKLLDEDSSDKSIGEKISDEMTGESPYHYKKGDVKNLTLEDAKRLHQQILQNAQGTIFITIPQDKLKDVKDEIFQTLMKVPTLQPYDYKAIANKFTPIPLAKKKIFTEEKDDNQIQIKKIFKIIENGNINDKAGLMVLNGLLGGDEKSKLSKYLRNEDKIAYSAYSDLDLRYTAGNISRLTLDTTVAADKENKNLRIVIEDFDKSINELVAQPVSQKELDRVKAILRSRIMSEIEESSSRNNSIADYYDSYYGVNYQQALLDAIDKMTPEYVQKLAQHYLTQPYLMSVVGNKETIEANQNYINILGAGEAYKF